MSGLAVVEENSNSLVGQISCTDIREITPNAGLMLLMYLPVKDFLMRRSLDNVSIPSSSSITRGSRSRTIFFVLSRLSFSR